MHSSTKEHDVFLSFRGEDTRTNFTSHLYNALSRRSIRTYIDYQLNRGEDVWPALAKAIEESHVSIVVFSENYASSKWCLEELVRILECRKQLGLVVIPVFYEVDPTHIRKQSGSYDKAFAKHERDLGGKITESNKQKVFRWKAALTEAANISGWDSRTHRDESHIIDNVVNDVVQKLQLRYPAELKGLVGTDKNCKKVELLLKRVRVVGIWGMGGIGKSTIAKVLFAKLFPQYDHVCFVANSKEYSLDKLFFALLKEEVSKSNIVGSTFDMRRLSSKKVLIVLDDMDSLNSLEFLCREYPDLDRDSRLIITTRDRQLLVGRVDWIYKVKKWKNRESLKLFCLEAFKKRHPQKGYENLSETALKYAGGVPLALKVLGSYFHSRSINFWESTLRKLNKYPNEMIQNVLKESYNGLDDPEKNIFLDIAYFFKEKKKDHVVRILDACGFEATSGIEVLEDKALITISNSHIIQMHDLLQKMGLEIVRQECKGDPGKRSRLKDDDAREVIEKNKGTDAIQGIALDLSQFKDLLLHADTFTKMKTLRFLKFYNTLGQSSSNTYLDLPVTLEPFSDELRYIEWIGYPFESLPSPFCAKFLVEIHMPHSKLKQLWQGRQELDNLEGINLSECKQFQKLPDLSKAPKLKWVNLSCCESLRYLHPSVLSSDTLVTLILDMCTNLERVKGEKHLKSLKEISVNGCISLEEFAVSSDLIENLDLSNTGIQTLDTSIGRMHKLKWLNLEGLRLAHPLEELSCLTSLKELKLSDSGLVIDKDQLRVLFDGLRSLQILHMKNMSNLFELPDNISVLSQLYELRLDGSNVERLPESIKNLQELQILSLENCKKLLHLPTLPSRIKYLGAINCTSLVSVSNLKTLATEMWGMTKFITFKNSLELDSPSFKVIMENLHLTMMSAAFHNVLVRKLDDEQDHSYNYTGVELCLPGRRIPWKITHRTTNSSISIELPKRSKLLGFIYALVLSPAAGGMKKDDAVMICECHFPEARTEKLTWHIDIDVRVLNSDHVYVWYDPFKSDSILKNYEPEVCFEFKFLNDGGEISIKECGIRLISVSKVQSVLEELDLDLDKKKDLEEGVEWEIVQRIRFTSIEESDKEESNGMRNQLGNQQRDFSEHSSSDSIVGTESDSDIIESDSAEEGNMRENESHYSDVKESVNSTHKETKTDSETDCRQNTRESTNAGKYEGSKGMPIKPDATLHETVESQSDKEIESKEKSRPKSVMDELESVEDHGRKDHFSDVEESIGYTHIEEIKSVTRNMESITEYTDDIVQLIDIGNKRTPAEPDGSLHDSIESHLNTEYYESEDKSITQSKLVMMVELENIKSTCKETQTTAKAQTKGNKGKPTESDDGLHLPMVSVNEANGSKEDKSSELNCDWPDNNIEEAKHSEENENLQGEEIVVHYGIHDVNVVEEPNNDNELDEDPFSEVDSILLRSPKSSAKITSSATNVTIREALHNLHCLMKNSPESILGDIELQQLRIALECIEEASQEKVSPNLAKLVEGIEQRITFPSIVIEQFDDEESNGTRYQIENQQWDLSEHISSGSDTIVASERSMHKETKTNATKENTIKSTEFHSSDTHENAQETLATSEEVFHPKPTLKLHPEVVESSSDSSDTNTREKVTDEPSQSTSLQASSEGGSEELHNTLDESKKVVETQGTEKSVSKYSSLDLEDCLPQLDENPFAILDLLSRELSQPDDVTTILNEFRTLVFSTSLLKKLPDQSYQQQIEESLQKLETYRGEMKKEQEQGLDKFIELYNNAVNISRDKMLTEDELAKVAWEKKDLYSKLQDSKLKVQQFDTTISTSKSQIENLQGREREIQEAMKKFQEENEAIEKERSKLESLYSEQQAKKNETLQSVKHISTSVVHTRKQWEELQEKRLSLASAYKDLKEPFRTMKTNPPF